jgi:hypothetical protein
MLPSYYLADTLGFRKKYEDKIVVIPNFIDTMKPSHSDMNEEKNTYTLLTVTSFKFYEKGRGILNLAAVVQ